MSTRRCCARVQPVECYVAAEGSAEQQAAVQKVLSNHAAYMQEALGTHIGRSC